ncbi:hypothetical protein J7384_18885 [Endozoicomonas sp. G2_1]|uniref:hypothetical protein n=1 Tax=Endozoicomonas sp. G2_1 TaxID=2821091 RepID=UPI001AD9F3CD|nr:hypothetical protein [Endozoicomonas sp. G2_1]MBO9492435.1 hypothetical protein [Endozoicomonas sp. G2_1]
MIEIDGRVFTYTIASDVIRDGLGAELNEIINGKEVFIAEVFRNDTKLKIEFSTFEVSVPYDAIVKLFEVFESKVTREFDINAI